jgi:hypothetical protein
MRMVWGGQISARGRAGRVGGGQQLPRMLRESRPRRGKTAHPCRVAHQQGHPNLVLQALQPLRQCGPAHMHASRGPPVVPLLGQDEEAANALQVEIHQVPPRDRYRSVSGDDRIAVEPRQLTSTGRKT